MSTDQVSPAELYGLCPRDNYSRMEMTVLWVWQAALHIMAAKPQRTRF